MGNDLVSSPRIRYRPQAGLAWKESGPAPTNAPVDGNDRRTIVKIKLRIAALVVGALAALTVAPHANAMHCSVAGQPDLSDTCNQVLGIVCGNPKLPRCE